MLRQIWRKFREKVGFILSTIGFYLLLTFDIGPYVFEIYRNHLRHNYPQMTTKELGEAVASINDYPLNFIKGAIALVLYSPRLYQIYSYFSPFQKNSTRKKIKPKNSPDVPPLTLSTSTESPSEAQTLNTSSRSSSKSTKRRSRTAEEKNTEREKQPERVVKSFR